MKKLFKNLLLLSFAFMVACSIDPVIDPPKPDDEEIPDVPVVEKIYEVVDDNLYYTELQLNVAKTFTVTLKELDKDSKAEGIVWYVNKEKAGIGTSYTFAPTQAGKYLIEYKIAKANSITGKEQTKIFNVVAYDMKGVLMLEESNLASQESYRGVSQYVFGTQKVSRYIKGDFTSFGVTSNYLQGWDKHLYNLSSATTKGVALSKFTTGATPKMVASVVAFNAPVKAFAGINENIGVVITNLANVIDLNTLAVKFTLKGSNYATNVFVADGYVFVITAEGAKAYSVDSLSAETEPKLLGAAKVGFIQSKDGSVWAFNGKDALRINMTDMSISVIPFTGDFEVKNSIAPWKQYAMASSTKENAIFLMNDGGWGTGKTIHKYDTEKNILTKDFITIPGGDWDNMLYGTSIVYNAQTDELVCAVLKGYGADFSNTTIYTFNASTGVNVAEFAFSTLGEGNKDMWANGMLVPIKEY